MGEKKFLYTCPVCYSHFTTELECEDHMKCCRRQKVWRINLEKVVFNHRSSIQWHVNVYHQDERSPFHFNEVEEDGVSVDDKETTFDWYVTVEKATDIQAGIDKLKLHAISSLLKEIEDVKNASIFPKNSIDEFKDDEEDSKEKE